MNGAELRILMAASQVAPMRRMAIIKGARFGLNAFNEIGLSFGVYIGEGVGAPQFLNVGNACRLIAAYEVGNVSNLDGKPCWVKIDKGVCSYEAPCLI